MSQGSSETITVYRYYTPPKTNGRSSTPPPALKDSQVPKDLRPTILAARKHPNTNEVVKQVNDFFLKN